MPKYGVHYLVLDKTREEMSTSNRTDLQRIGEILKSERFAASLGAIGPDLFLWTPDYEFVDSLRDIVQIYRKVTGAIDDINEISETIKNNIKDGVDPIINGIKAIPGVGDVFSLILDAAKFLEEMKEYFEESLGSIKAELLQVILIKRLGLDGSDPENTLARSLFQGLFQSSHQMGREESDWYWIEMLHYRQTGDFSKALIKNAEMSGSNTQIAYAYAYATHCATDLVGHPYVNTVSGSPFRINVQGHSTTESFIDQWTWINVEKSDNKKGNNIRTELMSSLELGADMPDEIANLLARTIRQVFMDVAHPVRFLKNTKDIINLSGIEHGRDGFLTEIDIKTAYDFQYIVLDTLGGTKPFLRPVEPYPGADDDLADIISKEQLNLNEYPSSDNSFPEDIDHFLEDIDHVINWTIMVCAKLSDVAITLTNGIAGRLNQLQTNPSLENIKNEIELYAYGMQCLTYEVYREIHQIIALTGLTYPEPDDVDLESPLARRLISLDGSFNEIRPKPLLKTPGQNHLDKKSYLSLATTPNIDANNSYELFEQHPHEGKTTFMSSYLFEGFNTPDWFIDKIPLNLPLMRNFAQSDSPEQTIALQQQRESFGSAVNISILMAKNWQDGSADQDVAFCNWNLDGDRGYGYKTWEGVPFTVAKGETDGILKGFEKISIVENQDFSTWTNIIDKSESQNIFKAVFEREYYINNKKIGFGIISPLIISEDNIPSIYTTIDGLQKLASSWPDSVLAARLTPTGNEFLENFYFCNGLTTTPSAAARACIALQMTLKSAPSITEIYENIKIKLIHNYTSAKYGDLSMVVDLIEAAPGDYLDSLIITKQFKNGEPPPPCRNPTQLAFLAILYQGMKSSRKIILSGHSQGAMISANAIIWFASMGQGERIYLRKCVRVLHLEPEIVWETRNLIRSLVERYLVYVMNDKDPEGIDIAAEMFGGQYPLMPPVARSIANSAISKQTLTSDLFALDVDRIRKSSRNVEDKLNTLVDAYNELAHHLPIQLQVIAGNIAKNQFRTDPATLGSNNQSTNLSTAAAINPSSIKVRNFFIDQ